MVFLSIFAFKSVRVKFDMKQACGCTLFDADTNKKVPVGVVSRVCKEEEVLESSSKVVLANCLKSVCV
eukprot:CAMPEP_0179473506 /NCGR_PEP_ID=MMETSP0799-20121207/53220_1 /TAXON_ID=46947 /ORGANISM="Geminigera cryophila, Strain CCMP2564" /LENGTH=67 /DNA_ID=CAMNT_0021282153 /DNA_START=433 /DNA_END=636 /DNA_ORIENTATION=-